MLKEQHNSRAELLQRLAVRLDDGAARLSKQIAQTLGKPIHFSKNEVHKTAELLNAGVKRFLVQEESFAAGTARVRWRPLGTVAVITPANNPVFIPLGKIHAALLYGNSVLWKPAPETEIVSQQIYRMMIEVGFSETQIQLQTGGREAAEAVLRHPQVSAVAITGSEAAGRTARLICAERNLPLQAELGGNNAAIVWSDADLKAAARAIAQGAFEMAGQRCTANRRAIVLENNREAFLEELIEATRAMTWGDPLSSTTQIGPLVSPLRSERVSACINRVQSDGDRVLLPIGESAPEIESFANCWFPPTIVCCDDPAREIVQEETFGPVLVVQSAQDWDHAIELNNGVRQGLVASIFTHSVEMTDRFLDQAQAGMLKLNQSTSDAEVDIPFCAWKASGSGPPEHGIFNRHFYTRPQTIYGSL